MKTSLMKRTLSSRTLAWLCVAVLLTSLMPLYALSFFNHACYDDFGFSLLTRETWLKTGSFLETIGAAFQNAAVVRHTGDGTYAASFISALQPAVFGEDLYWISTLLLLTFLLFALWFFLRQVLLRTLHVDVTTFWMALCSVSFAMIQFVPEMSEAFFWFHGGAAYTLLWSVMLVRFGVWLAFRRASGKGRRAAWYALLLVLTAVVGGAKYSTLLLTVLADVLMIAWAFLRKRKERWMELAVFALLAACFLFSASAPVSAATNTVMSESVSAPMAVLRAFYFGLALAGSWFSLPMLVVWALVAWQLAEALRGSPYRFNHPIWITVLSVCLFCVQLLPALFSGSHIGDGRTINTYFYTFVLMSCALVLYWMGWGIRRTEGRTDFPAIGTAQKDGLRIGALIAALVLLIVGCMSYRPEGSERTGVVNLASLSALRSLLNGEAEAFDDAMEERNQALNDPEQPEVILQPVEIIPEAFRGDVLESGSVNEMMKLYEDYYNKQRVSAGEEE